MHLEFINFWGNFNPTQRLGELCSILRYSGLDRNITISSIFGDNKAGGDYNFLLNWESHNSPDGFDGRFSNSFEQNSVWAPLLIDDTRILKHVFYDARANDVSGFASMIFSNKTDIRMNFAAKLLERCKEKIFIGGNNCFANVDIPERFNNIWQAKKLRWMHDNRCIFNICTENTYKPGYVTEKIRDAYMTRHIPVYYGCTDSLDEYIPEGSYIQINPDNLDETIDEMLSVYKSPEKQKEMLDKAPIKKLCEKTAQEIIAEKILKIII